MGRASSSKSTEKGTRTEFEAAFPRSSYVGGTVFLPSPPARPPPPPAQPQAQAQAQGGRTGGADRKIQSRLDKYPGVLYSQLVSDERRAWD
jgi:hypothetical protein